MTAELNTQENTMTNDLTTNEGNKMTTVLTNDVTAVNDELTTEDKTMTNEKLNAHITKMNNAISVSKNSNKSMFQVFKDAYNELKNDIKSYKTFKDRIELEQSTINKMEKICSSKAITDNSKRLPISWGTLHAISTMKEADIVDAIENKKFHCKTTKKEVVEYKWLLDIKNSKGNYRPVTNIEDKFYGTEDDAFAKPETEIIENNFLVKLGSIFNVRNEVNEENHNEIHQAFEILNKYFQITPNIVDVEGV